MTAVQRDHEHKSQKVEREISDAAAEEARRKEKVLQEERLRQQKVKAEEEVCNVSYDFSLNQTQGISCRQETMLCYCHGTVHAMCRILCILFLGFS